MSAPGFILYPGDYHRDTAHLETEEHGAYLLLLLHLYARGGRIPLDMRSLSNVARMSKTRFANMWEARLAPFFIIEDDEIRHKRVDRELAKQARISAARSEAGSKPKPRGYSQKTPKTTQKSVKNAIRIATENGEKIEEKQQNAETNAKQLLPTETIDSVSTPYGVEKPNLTASGEAALARLLDAAARAASCSQSEIRRFREDVRGFVDGALIVGGRKQLEHYSQSMRWPLAFTGLRLECVDGPPPEAKAG